MKPIEKVTLYECAVGVEYKGSYTTGWKDPDIPVFLLEVSAGGVSGFGECVSCARLAQTGGGGAARPVPTMSAAGDIDERAALRTLGESLLGKNALGLGRLIPGEMRNFPMSPFLDAVDFALHDLVGKTFGIPARAMLGGVGKAAVWGMPVIYHDCPETMSDRAREWKKQYGFRYFKLKPHGDLEKDEETLRKVREKTSGDVRIYMDPNFALAMHPEEVISYLNRLSRHGLAMCEDPIDADFGVYADMRRRSQVPLMIDYHSRTESDILEIVQSQAADAINIHANWAGGFQAGLSRARLAEAGGVDVMIGSTHYLGVGAAAYQILASLLKSEQPCEQVYVEVYGGKGAIFEPFPIANGAITIPDKPGLGVEPDRERLAALTSDIEEID